jgi:2-polyprenyl-3-methyl-5-hydroxy-6-metoxy-1,4-benzoquinol methylase
MNDFVHGPPFFAPSRAADYLRPDGTPWLLRRDRAGDHALGDAELMRKWQEKQRQFIRWTRDAVMFNATEVAQNYALYNEWFRADLARRLKGRVLDVGGGWGLFREWWTADADGCFVVHDPGVERFTTPPPETLRRQFAVALERPAWFVEGFGEDLPYQDGSYDTVAVISALDHCAQPTRVVTEAARVLKPGGRLFLVQGIEAEAGEKAPGRSFAERLVRVISSPQRLHRALRQRLFHRGDPHLHHFTLGQLLRLVAVAGFANTNVSVISPQFGVAVVEAWVPG